jgi:hypothetical protein
LIWSIHDVRTSSLSQVVKVAYHRPVVEVNIKHMFILECTESKRDLSWNGFGLGVAESYVLNDGFNQSTLGKFIGAVAKFLDADSHIICWVALILNVESQFLDFLDCMLKLGIVITQEDTIVHIDHGNDVTAKEDTIINQQRSVAQWGEHVHQELIPYPSSLLLTIDVLE